jgi:hypothetical protein
MTAQLHIVLFARGRWWVDIEGHSHGPFPNQAEAARAAIAVAHVFGDPERNREVLVAHDGTGFATIWSSALDGYPPDNELFSDLPAGTA